MAEMMWQTERNEMCAERHELSVERLNQIMIGDGSISFRIRSSEDKDCGWFMG